MHLGYTLPEAEQLLEGAAGRDAEELIGAALRAAGTAGSGMSLARDPNFAGGLDDPLAADPIAEARLGGRR